jgi:hypothetical protein
MRSVESRRQFLGGAAATLFWVGSGVCQEAPGHHKPIEPVKLPLDRDGVWTLNFAYTPVRIITVNTPDRGKRIVWYMVYQVWNKTDTPKPFNAEFLLVTKDSELPASYLDEPEPFIARKIREIEDPTGALNIQTCISIRKNDIPVTKPNSIPRAVHGVAIWPDVSIKSSRTNRFSVYVSGLSNGIAVSETETGARIIRKKTLQIDFIRPADDAEHRHADIQPNDNNGLGAEKWIYRESAVRYE